MLLKLKLRLRQKNLMQLFKKAYNKNKMHFNVQGFRKEKFQWQW